jgi:hypothetical protein
MRKLPEYLKQENFDQTELQKLLTAGDLDNKIDSFNTISFSIEDTSPDSKLSDYILLIPTEKRKPIPPQVETYVPTNVTDYAADITSTQDEAVEILDGLESVEQQMNDMLTSEQALQAQIDELSNRLDTEISNSVKLKEDSVETYSAARDIIVSQRIAAGEGNSPQDFSDVFPFLPATAEEKANQPLEPFPFMGGYE